MFNVNVGVVGVGGVGAHHTAILKGMCKFVGIYDIREDIRKEVSQKFNVHEFKSLEELLEHVDVVFICTPPFTHADIIELVAEEGKHIFCEKPLSVTVKDAERVVKVVNKSGVLFMMGFVLRFHPLYVKVKELLDRGVIGRIVNAWFFDVRGPFRRGVGSWRLKRELNSGVFEQVVHEIDLIRWTIGEPSSVFATSNRLVLNDIDYEDNMIYAFKMKDRSIVTLISSICSKSSVRDLGIIGSKGTLLVNKREIFVNDECVEYARWNAGEREDSYFLNCVERGIKPMVDEIDGYRAQVIGEAALKSTSLGKEVKVEYKY